MSKTVEIEMTNKGYINIEWSGDWDGICCGPEESILQEKLKDLGVELETTRIYCKLSEPDRTKAKTIGICIQGGPSND